MSSSHPTGRPPLEGVRVLDLTLAMAGPAATQRLADLGARVVKVEAPGTGDFSRRYPISDVWLPGGTTTSFVALNRAKRSVTLNLKHPAGAEAFRRLADGCDIVIQNFRPGVVERLGIDSDALLARNPRLAYVSISGWGSKGPLAAHPGQDLLVQAFSGLMWNVGREGDPPIPAPIFVADAIGSHLAVEGALAALYDAARTGRGRAVEVSLLGGLLEAQAQEIATYLATGRSPKRSAERVGHTMLASPYGVYRTADGYVAVAMADLGAVGEVIGAPGLDTLADDRDAVFRAVSAALVDGRSEEWVRSLTERGVWAGPVLSYDSMVTHPQVVENGLVTVIDHPVAGEVRVVASPFVFDGSRNGRVPDPPPRLGEHTEEVLAEAGYTLAEVAELRAAGAV